MDNCIMEKDEQTEDRAETARQRSSIYGFLGLIYRAEVTRPLLTQMRKQEFLSMLSGIGAQFDEDFLKKDDTVLIEDLAVEYTRLFLGPGRHISPHESVHHERDDGDWGKLWGGSTVDVKKFIESAGLHYQTEYSGLPDHISVELEFMGALAMEEALAWGKNDAERAEYCRQIQRKFMDWHLSKWIPKFCDKVIPHAELPFYREMAKVTKSFMQFENDELNKC